MNKYSIYQLYVEKQEVLTVKDFEFQTQMHPLQERCFMFSLAMKYSSSFSHYSSLVALSTLAIAKIRVANKIMEMLDICNPRDFS